MSSAKPALVKAIRLAIGGAMGVSAGLAGPLAQAQEKVEEIYVTGSRIARTSDFENPSPIVAFDRGELEKSGYANLQQLLEKQSFAGNGTFSTRGNNQDSTANGAASISLRGMRRVRPRRAGQVGLPSLQSEGHRRGRRLRRAAPGGAAALSARRARRVADA